MATSVYAFARGGAFAEALRDARAGVDDGEDARAFVYLDAFRSRARAVDAHGARGDRASDAGDARRRYGARGEAAREGGARGASEREREDASADEGASTSARDDDDEYDDGTLRYSKAFMLSLRDACVECPVDVREASEGAYPWRARDVAVRAVAPPAPPPMSPPRVEDCVMIDGDVDLDDRSLWCAMTNEGGDGEAMFVKDMASAAETMRRMTSSSETPASSSMVVHFRAGAVRDFTKEIARTHFCGFVPNARRGEAALGILYGTRRRAANAKSTRIDVAFIHPWDGDVAHVLSWLGSQSDAELISPVGWVRANANVGLALPVKTRRAYAESTLADAESAARLFMTLDVVTSTYGALEMECYDLHTGDALEYFLAGADAEISLTRLNADSADNDD
jgi:hypothetical protein